MHRQTFVPEVQVGRRSHCEELCIGWSQVLRDEALKAAITEDLWWVFRNLSGLWWKSSTALHREGVPIIGIQKWVTASYSLLSRQSIIAIFDCVHTSDKKWILYDISKRPYLHLRKNMPFIRWISRHVVHYELLPTQQIITANMYSKKLDCVQHTMKTERSITD